MGPSSIKRSVVLAGLSVQVGGGRAEQGRVHLLALRAETQPPAPRWPPSSGEAWPSPSRSRGLPRSWGGLWGLASVSVLDRLTFCTMRGLALGGRERRLRPCNA